MERKSFFDTAERYIIKKPIRLIELFAGIGAQAKALERIGVDFEHYKVCEIDKHSIKSYNAIHSTDFITSDISKLHGSDLEINNTDKYDYILTYSFPCTDLSSAGQQLGMSENSQTRSSLLWQVGRILTECRERELPQILLMENVVQVHSKENIGDFNRWLDILKNLGYKNYLNDVSALSCGIPQTRTRSFMISILGNYSYNFPELQTAPNNCLDFLDKNVDYSYYITNDFGKYLVSKLINSQKFRSLISHKSDDQCSIGCYIKNYNFCDIVNSKNTWMSNIKKDSSIKSDDVTKQRIVLKPNNICGTLTTFKKDNIVVEIYGIEKFDHSSPLKDFSVSINNKEYVVLIRYLTVEECFRLMGFDDVDSEKVISIGTSKERIYSQTGNSIVVNVLQKIFEQLIR